MNDLKEKLKELIGKLNALGEDASEMSFWETIFEDLNEEEQAKIMAILEAELAKLKKVSKQA